MKTVQYATLALEKIVGGGQTLGTLDDGRRAFVWGGLPGEIVTIRITKKKSHFVEGIVTEVISASSKRIEPIDPDSYLSTSPWQIITFESEQHYKAALIEEAFELHDIVLPQQIEVYTDKRTAHYRNKVEFSWFSNSPLASSEADTLDLAFFQRGSKGKITIDQCSLLPEPMMTLALAMRDLLRTKSVTARNLKTLLIRCDQQGGCIWQLYLKDKLASVISADEANSLPALGGELIYSDPRSPASRITERLARFGETTLTDTILDVPFRYATEGFFQVNIPLYKQALRDIRKFITLNPSEVGSISKTSAQTRGEGEPDALQSEDCLSEVSSTAPNSAGETSSRRAEAVLDNEVYRIVDFYSGVGSIGLTIGGDNCTLVEIDEHAVREMKENIKALGSKAKAVLSASEKALEHITGNEIVIVDPPRAGLHKDVVDRLLETRPPRIIYLSCNPVTQARDVALLAEKYGIRAHRGYNFFPRTPHIEHLVVLDLKQ
ncbi:MAG: class I SAM-dependent RNA methyltransferase [Candidatus Saccharimonas sp.]|nr:class I SAM-dependent RNA methyltransferase [Candidatus Saccharimonas sp.]